MAQTYFIIKQVTSNILFQIYLLLKIDLQNTQTRQLGERGTIEFNLCLFQITTRGKNHFYLIHQISLSFPPLGDSS